ncbi:MAG: Mur ligase domain-containing protein [Planctomycetes bacterium]|nr:Mur ligase domain-containing protein [Planctomycetota bacterium]
MRYHFSGVGGAGMSPLARLMAARGHQVQGSDRGFDQGKAPEVQALLRAAGVALLPQDGGAVVDGLDRVVYSAAVEQDTPEMRAARSRGIALVPRPGLLAEVVNAGSPGVAISGTSGKSTVTGMIAWCLRHAGREATVLGGAALVGDGGGGCFAAGGAGAPVVAEACESDGTLVGYRPGIGLVHNITRDHDELEPLRRQFGTFAAQSALLLVNARCAEACALAAGHPRARRYGLDAQAELALEVIAPGPHQARGVLSTPAGEIAIELLQPGAHNLENAAAAAAVCLEMGLEPAAIAAALACFPGVARRFQLAGVTDDHIRVVDDYAHNADKIRAAVQAAQEGCDRLLCVFQPHGFGPARFLRPELRELWPRLLRPQDRLCYAGIYYAGGTVAKDISSQDLADDLFPLRAHHAPGHEEVLSWAADHAMPGDTVLVMGARDPDLPKLAQALFEVL